MSKISIEVTPALAELIAQFQDIGAVCALRCLERAAKAEINAVVAGGRPGARNTDSEVEGLQALWHAVMSVHTPANHREAALVRRALDRKQKRAWARAMGLKS
jgi:hypothetical protein